MMTAPLAAKRLEMLHELVPNASVIAVLVNPANPATETQTRELRDAARSLGLQLEFLSASTESEIDAAFGTFGELRAGALSVQGDPFLYYFRTQILALAAHYAIPAIYPVPSFVAAGGLMSYGNRAGAWRQVGVYIGVYIGKILRGAKVADLPVQQVVKVEARNWSRASDAAAGWFCAVPSHGCEESP